MAYSADGRVISSAVFCVDLDFGMWYNFGKILDRCYEEGVFYMTFEDFRRELELEIPEAEEEYPPLPGLPEKTVLRYRDEKSDKFWQCEYSGTEMMVNYGKWGTSGKYDIKVFSSEEECKKQAEKLIASKRKKGYENAPDFCEEGHLYFDVPDQGMSPLTSHPVFRRYCTADFYYDCGDDYAPFGNDTGFDILCMVEEALRKAPNFRGGEFAKHFMKYKWQLPYLPPLAKRWETDKELLAQAERDVDGMQGEEVMLLSDQTVIAAVLGKLKISGRAEKYELMQLFRSLDRMERMCGLLNETPPEEPLCILRTIRRDMTRYCHERYDWQYFSIAVEFDDFWHKQVDGYAGKARKVFGIGTEVRGEALARRVYEIAEELTHEELVPEGYKTAGDLFHSLGCLLGEAVCEHHGWRWMHLGEPQFTADGGFETVTQYLGVVSPDESFSFIPEPLIGRVITGKNIGLGGENDNTILLVFNMLERVQEMVDNEGLRFFPVT